MNGTMNRTLAAVVLCVMGCVPALRAQDEVGPPKVLVFNREFTKPGRDGSPHEKTESAYLAAAKAGKAPFHYLALTSMSGPNRALFISGFDSLAAWEAESKATEKLPGLDESLDRAMLADGDLLSEQDTSVFLRRDDLSLNPRNLVGARYMEIQQFNVKPGHTHEFEELTKMYMAAFKKIPGASWSTFMAVYGPNSNHFIALTPIKTLAEADAEFGSSYLAFMGAVGEDGLKKMAAMEAACIESEQENIFRLSPKMSLPMDEWIKAEPDFWKPKPAAVKKPTPTP